ncbi:hypothetical protein A0256_02525 [Mucilaginibacter sp. PAMC 26640]|nr:hypothetical protein A0256_02525 [Mucilaginibacter sp. PAMC 26640]
MVVLSMKSIFDYSYYRLAKLFYSYEGGESSRAIVILSALQTMPISATVEYLITVILNKKQIYVNSMVIFLVLFIFPFAGLTVYNTLRYLKNYENLKLYWEPQSVERKIIYDVIFLGSSVLLIFYFAISTKYLFLLK